MEGLHKKMTRTSKTKADGAAITLKKDTKDEGQRKRRAIEVQGKIWSRTQNNSGLLSKKTTSP